jgi:plasmid stabilization system protein ParE
MASELKVVWTDEAERQLDDLYSFILLRWTEREAMNMLLAVKTFEETIAKHPEAFREAPQRPGCRLALAHPNLTMVYRHRADEIIILSVFDNRSDDGFR